MAIDPGARNLFETTQEQRVAQRRFRRRSWIGGVGLGVGITAGLIYRQTPAFWHQYAREFGRPLEKSPFRPALGKWSTEGLHAAWLGHSTVLLQVDGFTILTDPVLSDRVGLGLGPLTLGLKRLYLPALALDQLPPIDLILLSHAHMDHFDVPTLRALENRKVEVVTARWTSDLLRPDRYKRVQEVGWNQCVQVGPARIRGLEVRHWGARMRTDNWRGYNGYSIETGKWRILFAGDTALTDRFRQTGEHHLALMPIGAYNPWIANHCSPEQAWRMANDARAAHVLPIHHMTFTLSREPLYEPIERFHKAAGSDDKRIGVSFIGQELSLA